MYDEQVGASINIYYYRMLRLATQEMAIKLVLMNKIPMLSTFMLVCCFPSLIYSIQPSSFTKLPLPSTVTGPESFSFDLLGRGPFTGVSDGRVVKYQPTNNVFVDFATTTSNRSKGLCDGTTDPDLSPICGRPLGLSFNYLTGDLYIADPYYGLNVVRRDGGLATQLATTAEGVPFRFLVAVDVDPLSGYVYFTDASAIYEPRNVSLSIQTGDSTARLLKYDPTTKQVTVLLRGLSGAVGTQVSSDGMFVLVSEFIAKRIQRYWLKGPKANTAEVFMTFQGNPNKIKRNPLGDFWVALNTQRNQPTTVIAPIGLRINAFGTVLETVDLSNEYFNRTITVVQEQSGKLYVGSRSVNFIGVYTYTI